MTDTFLIFIKRTIIHPSAQAQLLGVIFSPLPWITESIHWQILEDPFSKHTLNLTTARHRHVYRLHQWCYHRFAWITAAALTDVLKLPLPPIYQPLHIIPQLDRSFGNLNKTMSLFCSQFSHSFSYKNPNSAPWASRPGGMAGSDSLSDLTPCYSPHSLYCSHSGPLDG